LVPTPSQEYPPAGCVERSGVSRSYKEHDEAIFISLSNFLADPHQTRRQAGFLFPDGVYFAAHFPLARGHSDELSQRYRCLASPGVIARHLASFSRGFSAFLLPPFPAWFGIHAIKNSLTVKLDTVHILRRAMR
jgi:hypothetical protein